MKAASPARLQRWVSMLVVIALAGAAGCRHQYSSGSPAPVSPSAARRGAPTPTTEPLRAIRRAAAGPVVADAAAGLVELFEHHLVLPVAGASRAALRDSFRDVRDGGARVHHALDIMAPRGTPVLAADDGRILRISENRLGGLTIYTEDAFSRFVYYYAHLDRYALGIAAGQPVLKGDTLGFVGTTGNAPADVPHLHFQVSCFPADGRFWEGLPINPYPLFAR